MKKVLILDLDGTLYYQFGISLIMGVWLILYYIIHFWRWKEFKVIMSYRSLREKNVKNIVNTQYELISKKYHITTNKVSNLVGDWLIEKPLKFIYLFKDRKLIKIVNNFKNRGGTIIIYSDYPTESKLKTLNIDYDKTYDSTHPKIRVLKPNTKGLKFIIKENNLKKDEILYIGNRDSKDGECARKSKVDYIILSKYIRSKEYLDIKKLIGVE